MTKRADARYDREMRVRVSLGAFAITCAGLIVSACAGFSSEESATPAPEAGAVAVVAEAGSPPDTGAIADAQSIADAGNKLGPAKLLLTHPADGALASYDPSSGTIYVGHAVFLGGAIDVAARATAPRSRIIQT